MTADEAVKMMDECKTVNMVGQNIVKKAIEDGRVQPEAVLNICGVPHTPK